MDPTLAPGYVPPNKGKEKSAKGHHWAEVQKKRTRTRQTNSENGDSSSTASTPPLQTTVPSYIDGKSFPRHPRLTSWRAGRSALSDGEGIGGPADLEEVPVGVKRQALQLDDYTFPEHRLRTVMDGIPPPPSLHTIRMGTYNVDDTKIPLVIVSCGSYSPITYLHLRMFEMAADAVNESTNYEIMGGFFSPVSDAYLKPGLVAGRHRVRMCELACERTSNWLMVYA